MTIKPRQHSDAPDKRRAPGRPPRRMRQNQSDALDTTPRLKDGVQLRKLQRWVVEIHNAGRSYRWIAAHTCRGAGAHGYIQSIASGHHLGKRPRIRPTQRDYESIKQLRVILANFRDMNEKLLGALLEVIRTSADHDKAVAGLIATVKVVIGELA